MGRGERERERESRVGQSGGEMGGGKGDSFRHFRPIIVTGVAIS